MSKWLVLNLELVLSICRKKPKSLVSTGYCIQYQSCTNKAERRVTEHGIRCKVVFDLLKNYIDRGFHKYFDHFYTNLILVNDLVGRNIYSWGTACIDRGNFSIAFKKNNWITTINKELNTNSNIVI